MFSNVSPNFLCKKGKITHIQIKILVKGSLRIRKVLIARKRMTIQGPVGVSFALASVGHCTHPSSPIWSLRSSCLHFVATDSASEPKPTPDCRIHKKSHSLSHNCSGTGNVTLSLALRWKMLPVSPMSCNWTPPDWLAAFHPLLLVIARISLDSRVALDTGVPTLCPDAATAAHTVHMVNHTRDSHPHGKTYSIFQRLGPIVELSSTGKQIH